MENCMFHNYDKEAVIFNNNDKVDLYIAFPHHQRQAQNTV